MHALTRFCLAFLMFLFVGEFLIVSCLTLNNRPPTPKDCKIHNTGDILVCISRFPSTRHRTTHSLSTSEPPGATRSPSARARSAQPPSPRCQPRAVPPEVDHSHRPALDEHTHFYYRAALLRRCQRDALYCDTSHHRRGAGRQQVEERRNRHSNESRALGHNVPARHVVFARACRHRLVHAPVTRANLPGSGGVPATGGAGDTE